MEIVKISLVLRISVSLINTARTRGWWTATTLFHHFSLSPNSPNPPSFIFTPDAKMHTGVPLNSHTYSCLFPFHPKKNKTKERDTGWSVTFWCPLFYTFYFSFFIFHFSHCTPHLPSSIQLTVSHPVMYFCSDTITYEFHKALRSYLWTPNHRRHRSSHLSLCGGLENRTKMIKIFIGLLLWMWKKTTKRNFVISIENLVISI